MGIYVIKARFDIIHYLRLNGPKGTPYWSPTLIAKHICSIYPVLKYAFKRLQKFALRYLTSNYWGNS